MTTARPHMPRPERKGFVELPLGQVYQRIEPGPAVLLATSQDGRANVMTMSWHMMVDFEPPLIACVVSGGDFSFAALSETGEGVIAIPGHELAETVVGIGNCSGRDTDKFARFGLTALAAGKVRAPLIGECFVNLECVVAETRLVPDYGLFLLRVVKAWIDPAREGARTLHHRGFGTFAVDGETIRIPSKMP